MRKEERKEKVTNKGTEIKDERWMVKAIPQKKGEGGEKEREWLKKGSMN